MTGAMRLRRARSSASWAGSRPKRQRYDSGSKLGFLQATVDLAEQHAEVGAEFKAWLAQRAGVVG